MIHFQCIIKTQLLTTISGPFGLGAANFAYLLPAEMKKVCFLEEMVELVTVFGLQGVWDADVADTGLIVPSLATCV